MEHGIGVRRDRALDDSRVREVAGNRCDARIVERREWRYDIEQNERADVALLPACVGKRAALEQLAGETHAEETGAAGDDDAHGVNGPAMNSRYHNRTSFPP